MVRAKNRPERRRHPRAITEFYAVMTAGALAYRARVVNLSMGGALLDLGEIAPITAVAVGDRVSVAITCASVAESLELEARAVLWNTSAGQVPLLAIQFHDVPDEESELLEELMLEALAQLHSRAAARALRRLSPK